MQKNIEDALDNQQDLSEAHRTTELLLESTRDMHKDAAELHRIMYWRNMKLKVILTFMIFSTVSSVAISVVSKFA